MEILFLRNEKCEAWKEGLLELKLALSEMGIKDEIKEKVINTRAEAERYKFFGSPTILINGKDVELATDIEKKVSLNTCRTYLYQGKFYEYPPKEMILHTLELQA